MSSPAASHRPRPRVADPVLLAGLDALRRRSAELEHGGDGVAAYVVQFLGNRPFPSGLRELLLTKGSAVVPPLLDLFGDRWLLRASTPGEGWAPIHAFDLLVDLGAREVIEPAIELLRELEWEDLLLERIMSRLPSFGTQVIEPALRAYERLVLPDALAALAEILASQGTRDPRILDLLLSRLRDGQVGASEDLATYGDPAAIPHLCAEFNEIALNDLDNRPYLIGLGEAIGRLGRTLSAPQRRKLDAALATAVPPRVARRPTSTTGHRPSSC